MLEAPSLGAKNLLRSQTPHQIGPYFQYPDSIKKNLNYIELEEVTPLHHFGVNSLERQSFGMVMWKNQFEYGTIMGVFNGKIK